MNNRQVETFFSEDPEGDLWRELLQFTYYEHVKQFMERNNHSAEKNTINNIVGAFLQAHEYFGATSKANLQIAPLLLYYGTTNLLYGMTNLLTGSICDINNHGMQILLSEDKNDIAETGIRFNNTSHGGIHVFARQYGFDKCLTNYGDWTLKEIWDSVAEINEDYKRCYNEPFGKVILLDVFNTPDGKVEKIYFQEDDNEKLKGVLDYVEGFKDSYLPVEEGQEISSERKCLVLKHKYGGKDISEISYSGQPYLRAAHEKNGKLITLPTVINMYVALYSLATLCRYYPERWSPFVLNDISGEKLLVEKLLYYSRRMLPNFVLNHILGKEIQYVSSKYQGTNTAKLVEEHQIKKIVDREISQRVDREQIWVNSREKE